MSDGADFTDRSLTGAEMKAAGLTFACRYLSGHPGGWKELSLAEAKDKSAHGIQIVANWEDTGRPANTVAQGESDARRALSEAIKCGMPSNRPIYFSIDHDIAVNGADNYFRGVCNVLGVERSGCYGSAGVIQHLHGQGLIKWGWRTMSTGWHGGASTADCQVEQTGGATVAGTSIDRDKSLATDIGGWYVGTPPVVPTPVSYVLGAYPGHQLRYLTGRKVTFDEAAKRIQTKLTKNGYPLVEDGLYGANSDKAVKKFQEAKHLVIDGIVGPKTWAAIAALPK